MVMKLILANAVVFLVQQVARPIMGEFFALRPAAVISDFYLWQPVTYMFLHGDFMHLFFNMLILFFFGPPLEQMWGGATFLRYYLLCGIGGAALSMLLAFNSAVVGASGAIFGLYLAYGVMFPNNYVYLYFLFPVKAKYLVAGLAVFQLLAGLSGPSGIAYFAHLGGMATGALFFRDHLFRSSAAWRTRRKFNSMTQDKWNKMKQERSERREEDESAVVDSILDKISAKEKLTPTEQRILENYAKKRNEEE